MEAFVWVSSLGKFLLDSLAWELQLGVRSEGVDWETSARNFRLEASSYKLSFDNFRFEIFASELHLGSLVLELSLGTFR